MAVIEPAEPKDVAHVRRISKVVFEEYGSYADILPRFFVAQGVTTYFARVGKNVVGFIMVGFLPWKGGDSNSDAWIADILAIAVEPTLHRKGVGSALMNKMLHLADEMCEWRDVREIQLTCAATNQAGLGFFERFGFSITDKQHGHYSGGQPAVRMSRKYVLSS
jgi:ribosomal protein S18 acetylase RimI-like enzyme